MKIIQITPAKKGSKSGNRITALRWAGILRQLHHQVTTATLYDGKAADMMLALHAWRSRKAVLEFRTQYPDRPLVVALTGTDINCYMHSHPEETIRAMEAADALVCFHDLVKDVLPEKFAAKLSVIYQSADAPPGIRKPAKHHFNVCVIGHLREVKDPFRTAVAARGLPASSRIRIMQFGKALNRKIEKMAEMEMRNNPRYTWKGEVPRWRIRREFLRARLMVISSLNEGGANVLSEAIVAGVPVLASGIEGNIGLLGKGYAGYFPAGDTSALADLLLRAEQSPEFLDKLLQQCIKRRHLFTREHELDSWRKLIKKLNN